MDSVMEIPPHTPHPPSHTPQNPSPINSSVYRVFPWLFVSCRWMLVQVNMYDLVDYRPLCVSVSLCVCVCMYVCMYVVPVCMCVCMWCMCVCIMCVPLPVPESRQVHICAARGVNRNFEYMCMRWYTYTSFMDCRALHPPSPADPYEDWIYFFRSVWSRWGGDHSPRDTAIRLVSDHQV